MKFEKNISTLVNERKSIRNYEDRKLSEKDKDALLTAIHESSNPFGKEVNIHYLEREEAAKGEKLGTYGTIKGASSFIGISTKPGYQESLAAGYQVEEIVLKAQELGLGTVWLAATFSRGQFVSAMDIKDDEVLLAISPVGYPANKTHLMEALTRKALKASSRKNWSEMFFENDFQHPLSEQAAGDLRDAFENLRWAPSATNQQPWRVVKSGNEYHFYVSYKPDMKEEEILIKYVDLGIGISHFDLTSKAQGKKGHFERKDVSGNAPEDTHYVTSWIME